MVSPSKTPRLRCFDVRVSVWGEEICAFDLGRALGLSVGVDGDAEPSFIKWPTLVVAFPRGGEAREGVHRRSRDFFRSAADMFVLRARRVFAESDM